MGAIKYLYCPHLNENGLSEVNKLLYSISNSIVTNPLEESSGKNEPRRNQNRPWKRKQKPGSNSEGEKETNFKALPLIFHKNGKTQKHRIIQSRVSPSIFCGPDDCRPRTALPFPGPGMNSIIISLKLECL